MAQSAVHIISALVVCAACIAMPAAAQPSGRGHLGVAGGVRAFAAPNVSPPNLPAPRIAPRVVTPPAPSPRISVPSITQTAPIPSIPLVAHRPLAAPAHVPQPHIISSHNHSAPPGTGAAPKIIAVPSKQAAHAFGLAGARRLGPSHVIRNPFLANRPAVANRTFHGHFAQLALRHHHRRLGPVVVVGFIGPLFWPYAYDDFLNYTFYPYAYDAFWPRAYDDVYNGIIGVHGFGIGPAAAGHSAVCTGQIAGLTDWPINDIAKTVEADDVQRAALDELREAMAKALGILKAACPSSLASTPTRRMEAMHIRLSAMLEAVRIVRPPLANFYNLLSDEQKARFNTIPLAEDQNDPKWRSDLAELCGEQASGISNVPIEQIERAVRPTEAARAALGDLREAVTQAGELLKADCPTSKPITPVVRIDAMERRLDAMLRAVNIVQPALLNFYRSLTDEQKERFNRLTPAQS
jgi:ABC-type transporter MlaC component